MDTFVCLPSLATTTFQVSAHGGFDRRRRRNCSVRACIGAFVSRRNKSLCRSHALRLWTALAIAASKSGGPTEPCRAIVHCSWPHLGADCCRSMVARSGNGRSTRRGSGFAHRRLTIMKICPSGRSASVVRRAGGRHASGYKGLGCRIPKKPKLPGPGLVKPPAPKKA